LKGQSGDDEVGTGQQQAPPHAPEHDDRIYQWWHIENSIINSLSTSGSNDPPNMQ